MYIIPSFVSGVSQIDIHFTSANQRICTLWLIALATIDTYARIVNNESERWKALRPFLPAYFFRKNKTYTAHHDATTVSFIMLSFYSMATVTESLTNAGRGSLSSRFLL
ncbi:unnamed protein product, partial [Ixodes pacificus]